MKNPVNIMEGRLEDFLGHLEKIVHKKQDTSKVRQMKEWLTSPAVQDEVKVNYETKPSDALYFARILEVHIDLSDLGILGRLVDDKVNEHRKTILENERSIDVRNAIMATMDFTQHLMDDV